jgi:hypothetical protein
MDLVSFFAPLLGIAFVVERLLEAAFDVVERMASVAALKASNPDQYASNKRIITIIVGIIAGIILTAWLGVGFLERIPGITGLNSDADKLLSGAVAGSLAPYAHQILETLLNTQKLLAEVKEGRASQRNQ